MNDIERELIPDTPPTVPVSGIWVRRIGDDIQLLAEIDEQWRLIAIDPLDGHLSHIVEPSGILSGPVIAKLPTTG